VSITPATDSKATTMDQDANPLTRLEDVLPIAPPETKALAEAETARMVAALRRLDAADWAMQTDNTLWDVRAMAGHVLGMTETFSGLGNLASYMRAAGKRKGDGPFIDGLTAEQVDRKAGLGTDALIEQLEAVGPVAARWRASRRLMRHIPIKDEIDGEKVSWRMAKLVDIVLTRDTWMHRADLAKATGKPMELTREHDGRLIADAVAEWGRLHGQPCTLHLTGPAGGTFRQGDGGGEEITVDAVEFCRIVSGRGTGEGLLKQRVDF
jgi:uncharacterized protein (TIGR03083 family)